MNMPITSLETALETLRATQQAGRHAEALTALHPLAARYPENRDVALLLATSQRHLGQTDAALATLTRIIAAHPAISLLHQERGLTHIARREAPAAIAALLRAVNINPALPKAWHMLEGLYRLTGQSAEADTAAAHGAALRALPAEVVRATALYADGELTPAEALIRAFLLQHGDHPEVMRLLAKIGIAREVYDDAELLLAAVVQMQPDHQAARLEYAQTLSLRHKHAEARKVLAPLLTQDPEHRDVRLLASSIAVGLGEQDAAIALYRGLLADLPATADDPLDAPALATARADLHLWLGHALKTLGDLPEAIAAYRAAIAAMEAHAASASEADRLHLHFALGKAQEDARDYAASWQHYAAGNALARAVSTYRSEVFETNTAEQRRICTPAFFAARANWGCAAPDPIFVLGLPRAGSTLIEQILASHSAVEGTQELPDIQRYALAMQGREIDLAHPRYPAALADLTRDDVRKLGERFIAETRAHRPRARAFFIDKMPNNFRHIGLIHLILPNATIIDARRAPLACCFSNLKQLFAQGQEFAYAPEDIARYYRTYLDLMRHWDAALPGKVIRVINEELIADPEGQIRRLLAACGLPFEDACLAFHQNRRAVHTPSSEQVRRPINADGIDAWRPYEPWLGPLKVALGDALENWRA